MVGFASHSLPGSSGPRPSTGLIALAFGVVYLGYGLNFLAVKVGVESMPAFLFAGSHVFLAGLTILAWNAFRGIPLWLSGPGYQRAALAAVFLFVGGVGLVTMGEKLGVPSGVAAIIKASVPLWVAIFESVRPHGERPNRTMVGGLLCGALGVCALVLPRISGVGDARLGTLLLVASAVLFAIGTILVRHRPPSEVLSAGIAWMMLFGGAFLWISGLVTGELASFSAAAVTGPVLNAFLFLFLVHSLAAFSAMNWLLRYLPASVVATKFYVSPAIAVVAGWLVLGEPISGTTLGTLALILAGVGIVLWGEHQKSFPPAMNPGDADELEE